MRGRLIGTMYIYRDIAESIGIQGGTVFEREEFAPVADGVCEATQEILGPTFVGAGLLGGE